MSLLSLDDNAEMGNNNPAMARTVKIRSIAGSDASAVGQEKEAKSVGGIPSR